jgi:hypothetical protein
VIVTAPEQLRDELRQLPSAQLMRRSSRFRRSHSRTADELAIVLVLRSLARRIEAASEEANELEREIIGHVRALVPRLLREGRALVWLRWVFANVARTPRRLGGIDRGKLVRPHNGRTLRPLPW